MGVTSSSEAATEAIEKSRTRPSILRPPPESGIYAIYLRPDAALGPFPAGAKGLIYIGSSSNLRQRDFETHFGDKGSGFSTLRRSLGAILKDVLNLTAIRRGPGRSRSNITSYMFDPEGEKRLTLWMAENLEVGFCQIDDGYKEIEKGLIVELEPVLNLKDWNNPHRPEIKRLRRACAREARTSPRRNALSNRGYRSHGRN
jgi:hypothetical protein